jgi:hypothetical protein
MTLLAAPALPLHKAGPYVAAAYIVFVTLILIYVAIMALRLKRTDRDLQRLQREVSEHQAAQDRERDPEHVA